MTFQKFLAVRLKMFFCLKKAQENQGLIVAEGIIMVIRNIRYYDDPILRKRCKEVKVINDKIRQILDDMLDTLQQTENGAAIAANQIGILKRLVCLSFPNRCVKIIRPQKVTIQAQNEYSEEIIITAKDELAQCFVMN
jgi:peptide deformylase